MNDIQFHYGLTVLNPDMNCEIIAPPPPTWRDWLYAASGVAFEAFLFACAFTAFKFALFA